MSMTMRALLTLILFAGCSKDVCDAAVEYTKGCKAVTASEEATLRSQCPQVFAACSDDQKSEIASLYDCLASNKHCGSSIEGSSCMNEISLGSTYCIASSHYCTGNPLPCSYNSSQSSCTAVAGCTWTNSACTGTPTATCNGTSEASCEAVEGCSWD